MSVPVDLSRLHLPERIAAHVKLGELGRAREILASRLSQDGYDADRLEQLGCVLLWMGDHVGAGRNLFLSGRHDVPYDAAIQAFLTRFRNCNLRQFVSQWPREVRRISIADLSVAVQDQLRSRGADWRDRAPTLEDLRGHGGSRSWGLIPRAVTWLFLAIAAAIVAYLSCR